MDAVFLSLLPDPPAHDFFLILAPGSSARIGSTCYVSAGFNVQQKQSGQRPSNQMRTSRLTLLSSVCLVTGTILASQKRNAPLPVVDDVDLSHYQGKWFEIARLPARFERACAADVTAQYSLRVDGSVRVVNRCSEANGHEKIAKGIAKQRNPKGPKSQLKVSFFWPFYGDYWILDLDPQYRWALVGTPDRHYLWVLSREPELAEQTYTRLLAKARTLGFDVARVIRTRQSVAAQNGL